MDINRMISKEDYYDVLDVSPHCTEKQIKRCFQILSTKWHPQKNSIGRKRAEKAFIEICEAFEVLSNKRLRKIYDDEGFEGVANSPLCKFEPYNFSLADAERVFDRFNRGRDPFALLEENDPFFEDEFFDIDHDEFFEDTPSKFFETSTNTKKKIIKSPRSSGVEKSVKTVIVDKDGRRVKKTITTIINADGSQEIIEEESEEPSGRYLRDS